MVKRLLGGSTQATVLEGRSGEWVIDRQLGMSRASAEVWEAYLLGDEHTRVAVKLAANEEGRRLLERELERLTDLDPGDHIVEVVDAAERDGAVNWLATRLAARGSLLDDYSARPMRPLVELLVCVSQAVQGLRDAEVVHRDLHPGNILLYGNDHGPHVRVAGWGRSIIHGVPQPVELAPTLIDFAAAQVLDERCDADIRDDLFSLGAILWWGCSGRAPVSARRPNAVDGAQMRPPDRLDALIGDLPGSVIELVAQLLQPSREWRSPAFGGRTDYLQWLLEEIESGLEDVRNAERQTGRAIEVGPGAVAADRRPARALPPGAGASMSWSLLPSSALSRAPERMSAQRAPERPFSGTAVLAAREAEPTPAPIVTASSQDNDEQASTSYLRLRHSPRSIQWLLACLSAFHLAVGLLLLEPSSVAGLAAAIVVSLLAVGGIFLLDMAIIERLRLARRPLRLASTSIGGLLAVRAAIAFVIVLLVSQALIAHVFASELAVPNAVEHSQQQRDLATIRSALVRLEHSIIAETNAVSHLANAKLRERRIGLEREISDADAAFAHTSASQQAQLSGRAHAFLKDDPQTIVLYLMIIFTLSLLEASPIVLAQAKR